MAISWWMNESTVGRSAAAIQGRGLKPRIVEQNVRKETEDQAVITKGRGNAGCLLEKQVSYMVLMIIFKYTHIFLADTAVFLTTGSVM